MGDTGLIVRKVEAADSEAVEKLLVDSWGSTRFASQGDMFDARDLPGFIALDGGVPVGLLTYYVKDGTCELVTLNARERLQGIGTKLLEQSLTLCC